MEVNCGLKNCLFREKYTLKQCFILISWITVWFNDCLFLKESIKRKKPEFFRLNPGKRNSHFLNTSLNYLNKWMKGWLQSMATNIQPLIPFAGFLTILIQRFSVYYNSITFLFDIFKKTLVFPQRIQF